MHRRPWILVVLAAAATLPAAEPGKPVPAVEVLPLPYDQASFECQGRELVRYHFGPGLLRPFWYPIAGVEGKSLTRMGHPHDPQSHRHHYSVWISHADVCGVDFWSDSGAGRIVHQRAIEYVDGDQAASATMENAWQTKEGKTLLREFRRTTVERLADDQWRMTVDLEFEPAGDAPATIGQTPFGMIGVRMRKTIGVHDGGGRILNSAGGVNEAGVFRKSARWVDYAGPVTAAQNGGVALFDPSKNPGHPSPFHVRDDGWMGVSLTLNGPIAVERGKPLRLRYGLWVHPGLPEATTVDRQFQAFDLLPVTPLKR